MDERQPQEGNPQEGRPSTRTRKFRAPDYLREMNILEKLENHKIIQNMNKRINYLKNPRHRIVRPPIKFQDAFTKPVRNNTYILERIY